MPKRLLGVAAIASTAVLILPGAASAGNKAGEQSFEKSFPVASKLCAKVAAGTENKRLVKVAAQILTDCETLKTEFAAAQTTVVTARTTIRAQISADRAAIKVACPKGPSDTHPACVSTRHSEKVAIGALRQQLLAAVHLYYKTVESDRRAFWAEIKALRPARHLAPDKPIHVHNS
jgi:hypothetical protein